MQTVLKQMVGHAAGWGDIEMVGILECSDGGHQNLLRGGVRGITVRKMIHVCCCLVQE